jgi:uncharacterized membrane protein YgdD (TMEM256/DUF423 family)
MTGFRTAKETSAMTRMSKVIIGFAACSLLIATILDAYGSHVLEESLAASAWDAYRTAVRYQFDHSLGLIAVALLIERHPRARLLRACAAALCSGLVLFCGGIYASTFGAPGVAAGIPVGGSLLMLGWLLLALAVFAIESRRLE